MAPVRQVRARHIDLDQPELGHRLTLVDIGTALCTQQGIPQTAEHGLHERVRWPKEPDAALQARWHGLASAGGGRQPPRQAHPDGGS
jgi:hypothetical protein